MRTPLYSLNLNSKLIKNPKAMKLKLTFAALIVAILAACTTAPKHSLTVEIDGWDDSQIIIYVGNLKDTLQAENGIVTYDLPIGAESTIVKLARMEDLFNNKLMLLANSVELLIVGDEKVMVKGTLSDGALRYTTSQFDDDFSAIRSECLRYMTAADKVSMYLESDEKDATKVKEIAAKRADYYENMRDVRLKYIKDNPDSDLSAYFTQAMTTTRFMECYNLLSSRVKEGKYKILLAAKLQRAEDYERFKKLKESGVVSVGNVAPEFTLTSLDGSPVSLSDFKGRWVLIDFWGSWCKWCIKGFPEMKEFYSQYSDKVEILGIACNDKDAAWRKSIESNDLPWVHVLDDKGVKLEYVIEGYPTKILIDPDGKFALIEKGDKEGFYERVLKLIE